ncbi:MAG: hypothetical protein AMXMBFR80_00030 [Dehalococcoidia bacterium]
MTFTRFVPWRFAAASLAGCLAVAAVLQPALAQFDPPSTVFGSVADSEGEVPAGLPVEAYIGDVLCGTKGTTEHTGDGAARVTVYVVDVVSESQIAGCGANGRDIRVKIGDRFASQTVKWNPGPVQLDVTFGSATPAAIPTFTPVPTRIPEPRSTPEPGQTGTPGQVETIPPGSPGAGSPVSSPSGGITSATPGAQQAGSGGDGGFPVWGVVVLILGGIAAVGGGVGYAMSRSRQQADDGLEPPLE